MGVTQQDLDAIRGDLIRLTGILFDAKLDPQDKQHIAYYYNRKMVIGHHGTLPTTQLKDARALAAHELGHEKYAPRSANPNAWRVFECMVINDALLANKVTVYSYKQLFELANIFDDQIVNVSLVCSSEFTSLWGSDILDAFASDRIPFYGYMLKQNDPIKFHALVHFYAFQQFLKSQGTAFSIPSNTINQADSDKCKKVAKSVLEIARKPGDEPLFWEEYYKIASNWVGLPDISSGLVTIAPGVNQGRKW